MCNMTPSYVFCHSFACGTGLLAKKTRPLFVRSIALSKWVSCEMGLFWDWSLLKRVAFEGHMTPCQKDVATLREAIAHRSFLPRHPPTPAPYRSPPTRLTLVGGGGSKILKCQLATNLPHTITIQLTFGNFPTRRRMTSDRKILRCQRATNFTT